MILDTNNFINQKKLDKVKFFFIFISLILSIFQISISGFNLNTILIIIMINFSIILMCNIVLKKENLINNLFAFLMIIALNFFYLSGPLIIKTILVEEITSNLELPLKSFVVAFFYHNVVIIAFLVASKSNNKKQIIDYKDRLLYKLKSFNYLDLKSTISIFAILLVVKLYLGLYDQGVLSFTTYGNIPMKILYGYETFFYLPIIFYFNIFFIKKEISKQNFIIFLLINFLLFVLFGLLTNSRAEIVFGFSMIFVSFLIIVLFYPGIIEKKKIMYFLTGLILFSLLLQNLSEKILVNRTYRTSVTSVELLNRSINVAEFKKESNNQEINAETYISYGVLNRFMHIKYLDKSLYESSFFSEFDIIEFKKFSLLRVASILPENFINIFNKTYKKEDYLYATGSYIEQKSRFRTSGDYNKGSFITELFLLTESYFFSFISIFIIFFFLFKVISKFQIQINGKIIYSPLIILMSVNLFYLTGEDGLSAIIGSISRSPIQYIILYYFLIAAFQKKQSNIEFK
tara:strand:+ start:2587 stop:4137 length:1551 start_codon:yes stop_codon:yes gene_type:complete